MAQFQYLDPRLGEVNFRKYEALISEALSRWPEVTTFPTPTGIETSTFIARFRDVLLGYRQNRWPSSLFTPEQFDSIDGKFVLRADLAARTVTFDHKTKVGRPPNLHSPSSPLNTLGPYSLTPAHQHAFAVLLNDNLLPGTTVQVTHPLTIDLTPFPNVTTTPHTNGITLLL